jgi:hypothetical protein
LAKPAVPKGFTDAGIITLDDRVFWISNVDDPWHAASSWSSGAPPTPTQIAVIDVPFDITVSLQQCPSCTTLVAGIECAENFRFVNGGLTLSSPSVFQRVYDAGSGASGAFLGGPGSVTFNGPITLNGATLGSNSPGGTMTFNAGLTTHFPVVRENFQQCQQRRDRHHRNR